MVVFHVIWDLAHFGYAPANSPLVGARQNIRPFDRLRLPLHRRRRAGPGESRFNALAGLLAPLRAHRRGGGAGDGRHLCALSHLLCVLRHSALHRGRQSDRRAVAFRAMASRVRLRRLFPSRRGVLRVVRLQRRLAAMDRAFDQRTDDPGLASALSLGRRAAARRRGGKARSPRLRGEGKGERRGR